MPACFIRWLEVPEKEVCRKAFTLASCILQASEARRLACLKQTTVITLACCGGLRLDLYVSGVEAFWTRLKLQVG